jgi:hypothetical protein
MGADGQRHQQGSPGYRQSVTDNMANSSNSAAAATGQALQDSGSVAYVEVHQPITTTTAPGGATSSTLGPISGSTYGPGRPRTP